MKMSKFKDFYKKMYEEMSSPFSSYVNPSLSLEEKWEEYKDEVEDFYNYKNRHNENIFVKNINSDRDIFFFFINSTLRASIQYQPLENNGVKIKETLKGGEYGLFMNEVFTDFLLYVFDYILSDNYHTKEGIGVYKRLIKDKDLIVSVLNVKTKEEKILQLPEEIEEYYGPDKSQFVYKIQKK